VRPKDLFAFLTQHSWIYRRAGSGHWCAYQAHIASGDMVHKVTTVLRPTGRRRRRSRCGSRRRASPSSQS
jgi:phage antirepressor YoqD-like protein